LQVSGVTTYTYSTAKNKNSDTFDGYLSAWANHIAPTEETYTEWDQRHTLNFNLDVRTTSNLGMWLGGISSNILFRYGSGTRWTPPKGQDRAALSYTRVLPEKFNTDIRIGKLFEIGRSEIEFALDIRNLFDRKNVQDIADEEWYALFDGDGDGTSDYDPMGKYKDPTVYKRGRLVRARIQYNF
ncbi:MAG: hypothetical protein KAU50_04820, partial [Candidatus Marinimicrobia bacterium]|nr:hypothetical protein [Candidatus Neomarinimicrobiota bacterium]